MGGSVLWMVSREPNNSTSAVAVLRIAQEANGRRASGRSNQMSMIHFPNLPKCALHPAFPHLNQNHVSALDESLRILRNLPSLRSTGFDLSIDLDTRFRAGFFTSRSHRLATYQLHGKDSGSQRFIGERSHATSVVKTSEMGWRKALSSPHDPGSGNCVITSFWRGQRAAASRLPRSLSPTRRSKFEPHINSVAAPPHMGFPRHARSYKNSPPPSFLTKSDSSQNHRVLITLRS